MAEWNPVVPGIGKKNAEPGSVDWCERIRLELCGAAKDLASLTEHAAWLFVQFHRHRGWTTLTNPDTKKPFRDWDEFCECRQPHGLGVPWPKLRPYLEPHVPKAELDVITAPPDGRAFNGDGQERATGGRFLPKMDNAPDSYHGDTKRSDITEKRLRAIADRAPEPARDLYKAGLLGQKEAAKLGPKNPSPDDAARVTEVAQALAAEAKALPQSTPAEKEAAKRALNAKARTLLGVQSSIVTTARAAIARWAREATDEEWKQIVKALDDADTARAEKGAAAS